MFPTSRGAVSNLLSMLHAGLEATGRPSNPSTMRSHTYAPATIFRLSRCATSTRFVSAPQRSCPAGVRAYHIVGGDVGFRRRSTIPSRSSRRRRVVSIFADTPLRSDRSSEKQRSSSRRYQITSAVHAPLSTPMHSFSGHCEGGGSTLVLRRFTTKPSYQTVTRFCRADAGMPDRIPVEIHL